MRVNTTKSGTLWLRTGSSPDIGLGHLMRTLAIAESAHRQNLRCCFVIDNNTDVDRIRAVADNVQTVYSVNDDMWTSSISSGDFVVFDGYEYSGDNFRHANDAEAVVACFDDFGISFPAGVLVIDISEAGGEGPVDKDHQNSRHSNRLVGPHYAPIRSEFFPFRRHREDPIETIVISLGGSDMGTLTQEVTRSILHLKDKYNVVAIINQDKLAGKEADWPTDVEVIYSPPRVGDIFDRADLGICTASTTALEMAFMGIPTLHLQATNNQKAMANMLTKYQISYSLGTNLGDLEQIIYMMNESAIRSSLSRRALETIDGMGAERILKTMVEAHPNVRRA